MAGVEAEAAQPLAGLIENGPLLILSARPGDECLGCGGLIAACVAAGVMPYVLVLTDGTDSHPNSRSHPAPKLRRVRMAEAQAGLAQLGLPPDRMGFMGLAGGVCPFSGPAFDAMVTAVAALAIRTGAGALLSPGPAASDADSDATHQIAQAAAAEAAVRHLAYAMPLGDDTPPYPLEIEIDVSAHMPQKLAAMAEHKTQQGTLITDDPSALHWPPTFRTQFGLPRETLKQVLRVPG